MKTLLLLSGVTLCLFCSAPAQEPFAEANPVSDYIRYRSAADAGQPDILETAVSRFQKGNHIIDLISVVHLGDADYFTRLNQSLAAYDVVFYEMVGGPYTGENAQISRDASSPNGDITQVQGLQQMAKDLLGLQFQLDGLDYLAPNFVHADMSSDEFSGNGGTAEEMSHLLTRALKIAQSGKIRGLPANDIEANKLMSKVMGSILTGNSNQLKRSLGPILAEAESFISEMEKDEDTVLISKRNQIVIDKILENLATRGEGPKTDAILYGAGHMPDLEERLKDLGYQKSTTVWEPSWVIDEGASSNQNAPSVDQMLKQLSGLMEMMQSQ